MTVMEARRFGRGRNLTERRALRIDESGKKICIEIVTPDEKAQQIIESLVRAARTRDSGDGKVFVLPVDSAISIQTGETSDGRPDRSETLNASASCGFNRL